MEHGYNRDVERLREQEYPMLKDAIYLDHAGTTLYSKSLMERHMADMMSNLYGNPHSASASSQLTTNRIEDTRLKVLKFFNADPEDFEVVFVANATAGIKLVMEAFRSHPSGFNYGYHKDSHTSLIGVRENATSSRCLGDDAVERWLCCQECLAEPTAELNLDLFAYPAQSNLDGRRLPLSWLRRVKEISPETYTLLDASALVSTTQLDLGNRAATPDFTVLSFYKIFGYPDLGALIVKKKSGRILLGRNYFGGGTVDVVICIKEQWHVPKGQSLHDALEDGTLPFHSIIALDSAIDVHAKLYGSMDRIASHTAFLARTLYDELSSLKHGNAEPVCVMHSPAFLSAILSYDQGPVVAFNLRNNRGAWISNVEFEKLATVRKIHIRSGGLCNPGGIATALQLEPWEMRSNFAAGFKCGSENDIYAGKPTGIIRASLGAMSTLSDVKAFLSFIREFYVESDVFFPLSSLMSNESSDLRVESLTIYPIKSCGGLSIPADTPWAVRPEGLAWDREWCLIHKGTGQALNQKRHPRMALIRPSFDFARGVLCVKYNNPTTPAAEEMCIPLSSNPALFKQHDTSKAPSSRVCGETILARTYTSHRINDFFSEVLGVPCCLVRFPAGGSGLTTRHSKAHMQRYQRAKASKATLDMPGSFPGPPTPPDSDSEIQRPILLSNESPMLAIHSASLDALNEEIARTGGKPAQASVFRANIVLGSTKSSPSQLPYAEDHWTKLRIGQHEFQLLGSCRRCHMICIDQETAEKNEEPFVTLAKTRRFESKIFFGSHMCHVPSELVTGKSQCPMVMVGDVVSISTAS